MATAAASSSKRPRVGVGTDRLGDLPDCLLHGILSLLGSRQAVQTSALSRRWRHLWSSVPCIDIDQQEFRVAGAPFGDVSEWESFEDFADNMLSSPPGTAPAPLDAFRLRLIDNCRQTTLARWVRRGLRRRPAAVHIHHTYGYNIYWPGTSRSCSGTSRVTRLRFYGIRLSRSFGEDLGDQCPVLEDLHIENCMYDFCTIASPTLKSLALVITYYDYRQATLVLAAPRLASLRLVLPFGSGRAYPVTVDPENEVLASLVKASICITDKDELYGNILVQKHKLGFLKSMCNFLACLPNVRNLDLSGFTTTALLDEESQEFPVFHDLRTLILDGCDVGVSFQALMSILRNTPNLEKLGLHLCRFSDRPKRRRGKTKSKRKSSKYRSSTFLHYENLKSIEIEYQENEEAHWRRFSWKFQRECQRKCR